MSVSSNDYHGLWRASANEGVPYSEDFPEALLVLPEFIDGALGAGKASIIDIKFNITNPKECELIVNDNGKGLISEKRMKEWSSKDIGNNETENIYGHGSKKALTKFCPEYNNAKWSLYWRKQDKKGFSSALNILSSPFNGLETKHIEDDENEDICPIKGTCWKINFNLSVLGKLNNSKDIINAIQEIIRVRYEPSHYHKYIINIEVTDGAIILNTKSTDWKSLKECLESEISTGKIKKISELKTTLDKTTIDFSLYEMIEDGRVYKIPDMPTFGKKNMNSSRIHIARNGRYIEAMSYAKFMGKEYHNSDNGKIGFIIFTGEELPTPCTTKVKMQEECPIFKKMVNLIIKYKPTSTKLQEPKVDQPKEEPLLVQNIKKIAIKKIKSSSEIVKPKVEPKVEHKVEHKVEPKVKPKIEPKIEPKVEAKVEAKVESKIKIDKYIVEPENTNINNILQVIDIEDLNIFNKLYKKYGYKFLIDKLNEFNI